MAGTNRQKLHLTLKHKSITIMQQWIINYKIAVKTQCRSERWNLGNELKSMLSVGKPFHAFMTLPAKMFDLTKILGLLWCLKSLIKRENIKIIYK